MLTSENTIGTHRNIKVLLTIREKEVLYFLSRGFTDFEIAKKLFLSRSTIKTHRKKLLMKYDARNSCHLVFLALSNNNYLQMVDSF
jgi:DNA-binding CsgD family transcriptional regulator